MPIVHTTRQKEKKHISSIPPFRRYKTSHPGCGWPECNENTYTFLKALTESAIVLKNFTEPFTSEENPALHCPERHREAF